MKIKNGLELLKGRSVSSIKKHEPHGKGRIGKVMAVVLILNFILFVLVFFIEVLIPYWNGDFPSYRLSL